MAVVAFTGLSLKRKRPGVCGQIGCVHLRSTGRKLMTVQIGVDPIVLGGRQNELIIRGI